jgi:hypothetical protein
MRTCPFCRKPIPAKAPKLSQSPTTRNSFHVQLPVYQQSPVFFRVVLWRLTFLFLTFIFAGLVGWILYLNSYLIQPLLHKTPSAPQSQPHSYMEAPLVSSDPNIGADELATEPEYDIHEFDRATARAGMTQDAAPTIAPTYAFCPKVSLRVRAGPGTNYAMLDGLAVGECYSVLARNQEGTWLYLGQGGWVSADPSLVVTSHPLNLIPIYTGHEIETTFTPRP